MNRPQSLAETYRRFGTAAGADGSPLSARIAVALSEAPDALRTLEAAPARKRHPAVVLAALHDLALAGRAPPLAAALAAGDGDAAAAAAVATLRQTPGAVVEVASSRLLLPDQTGRGTVLYPAVAAAAARAGAQAVGLIDVGRPAGLNLQVDRVGVTYDDGTSLGDTTSPVQLSASVVGGRPVPTTAIPTVVERLVVDAAPVDVADADDARWVRACVPPDEAERAARLDAEIELATSAPPRLLRGDPVELLREAVASVPAAALPVVTTTWALSRLSAEKRLRFLVSLSVAAADRPVAWVSVEGVGVAPRLPTLGDRPASGHSIVGLTVLEGASRQADAVARCWSRGRMLAWLA